MTPGPLSQSQPATDASIPLLSNNDSAARNGVGTFDSDQTAIATRAAGYCFMALSALFHALMSFFVRVSESSYDYPTSCCLMVRAFTSIGLSILYLSIHDLFHTLKLTTTQVVLLSLRGVFGAGAGACTFFSLQYLPVGIAITILYSSPAITSVLAAIVLKEPFTMAHFLTLVLNFTGVIMTSRGSYSSHNTANQFVLIGVTFAILAAVFASIAFILIRIMGLRVHFILGCLFYGVGCFFLSFFIGSYEDVLMISSNYKGTFFALLSGFAGFGSQSMLTRGVQRLAPGPAAVVRSLNVPISFLLGLVFLSEKPSAFSAFGVSLVLLSIASVAWQKQLEEPRSSPRNRTSEFGQDDTT